jgi:hypothetical protein
LTTRNNGLKVFSMPSPAVPIRTGKGSRPQSASLPTQEEIRQAARQERSRQFEEGLKGLNAKVKEANRRKVPLRSLID